MWLREVDLVRVGEVTLRDKQRHQRVGGRVLLQVPIINIYKITEIGGGEGLP